MSVTVIAIAAMDEGRVIGFEGKLPWHHPEDMKWFADNTSGDTVLMGRKTYDSLAPKYKPLPKRKNIVITRSPEKLKGESGIEVWDSPSKCIEACRLGELELPTDKLWVVGGEQIYRETQPLWDELYLTVIHSKHTGDTYFPEFESDFKLVSEDKREELSFQIYSRK